MTHIVCSLLLYNHDLHDIVCLRAHFFLFLAYSGLVYAVGRRKKRKKKHTEHKRVQFLGTTEHEREPYTHATRSLKRTKARTHAEKTFYTIPRCTIIHLMQMSDSVPFGVMYLNASVCVSSSLLCGGVW